MLALFRFIFFASYLPEATLSYDVFGLPAVAIFKAVYIQCRDSKTSGSSIP